jgi:hypothetical protein
LGLALPADGYHKHNALLDHHTAAGSGLLEQVRQLRNAFAHSLYPPFALFGTAVSGTGFNQLALHGTAAPAHAHSIALQLQQLTNKYYDELELSAGGAGQ